MNWRTFICCAAVVAMAFVGQPGPAAGQGKSLKEQLIGSWTVVSWEQTYPDGRKDQAFGANPNGINTFGSDGRFSLIFLRPDLPKVASNDRVRPTPDEAMAISKGSIAYFGTYTVDEAEKSITLKIEATSYTNQLGLPQKRIITSISADELKYRNPISTSGGKIEVAFKRAK